MNHSNPKSVVTALIHAINHQQWQILDDLVAPNFVRHSNTFGQPIIRGAEQLRAFLTGESRTFPDAHEGIHFMLSEGDLVAVHSRFQGTQSGPLGPFPPSNRTLSADLITIYRVANGRIAEAWVEWDCLTGLVQLGHLKPPVPAEGPQATPVGNP